LISAKGRRGRGAGRPGGPGGAGGREGRRGQRLRPAHHHHPRGHLLHCRGRCHVPFLRGLAADRVGLLLLRHPGNHR